ncbi:hypothetical protein GCM10010238_60920 [Streptomyces griseoviridis]|uniref:Uncharacterized protein n=1 Tax=Streptomyces griseoviridis TaxID=45398 RepID=A0A918GVB4_STRGD|nr:hypothetical protein GCM10010238_60920 [Streptomyces niveoruber]
MRRAAAVVLDHAVDERELFVVRQRGQAAALDGEELERREPYAVQAPGRPAGAAVGVGERGGVGGPPALPLQQAGGVHAPRGGALQRGQRAREDGSRGGADRRVLGAQRQRLGRALRAGRADAAQGAGEDGAQGDGEEGGGRVGAVVDVLRERRVGGAAAALAPAPPDQGHGVRLQQQRGRAALLVRLRVEHVGRAGGGGERLRLLGVLVRQETEVGGGASGGAGGGDGQEHGPESSGRRCG